MARFLNIWSRLFNNKPETVEVEVVKEKPKLRQVVKPGRVTDPQGTSPGYEYTDLKNKTKFVTPQFNIDAIPVIRKLYKVNSDMGLVLFDLITLTNTGYKVKFNQGMSPQAQDLARKHIKDMSKNWGDGVSGLNGLINKMVGQIWIGGALSYEAEVNKTIDGISNICLVNPENIAWELKGGRYYPYQKRVNNTELQKGNYIKLNQATYKYFGLMGDEEIPYAVPPLLTALNAIKKQNKADENVDNIMELMGLLGFLEVNIEKPDQEGDESDAAYLLRLDKLLEDTKNNTMGGLRRGLSVGIKGDHEYKFNSTTQNISGVYDIYSQFRLKSASGLKAHPSMMGIDAGKSETHLSIVFTKMISQLSSIHMLLEAALEHIISLELTLRGIPFEGLEIKFNPSTVSDSLKMEQAKEIKVRNLNALYDQGIIDQYQYAEEMGYGTPSEEEPRVSRDKPDPADAEKKQVKEKKKDANDRKNRSKDKPQPKRKDTKPE